MSSTPTTSSATGLSTRLRQSLSLAQTRIQTVEAHARARWISIPEAVKVTLERVRARLLDTLDLPSRKELVSLIERIEQIDRKLVQLEGARAAALPPGPEAAEEAEVVAAEAVAAEAVAAEAVAAEVADAGIVDATGMDTAALIDELRAGDAPAQAAAPAPDGPAPAAQAETPAADAPATGGEAPAEAAAAATPGRRGARKATAATSTKSVRAASAAKTTKATKGKKRRAGTGSTRAPGAGSSRKS